MPIDYQIDPGRHLIRTRCIGSLTFDEVVAHFRALEADPRIPDPLDVLLDFSELTNFPDHDQVGCRRAFAWHGISATIAELAVAAAGDEGRDVRETVCPLDWAGNEKIG